MNNEEKLLYFKSGKIEINNITFVRMGDNDEAIKKPLEINVTDSYKIENYNSKILSFCFSRKVGFTPNVLFSVLVEFIVELEFADKTKKEYGMNLELLGNTIKEKMEKIVELSNVIPRASSLISAITQNNNGNPVVTPPKLIKQK